MSVCNHIQAEAGDNCLTLAQRCAIVQDDLIKYNPATYFCDDIKFNDYICCSAGSYPDLSPQPADDGSCFTYVVQAGETCAVIGRQHNIDDWNKIEGYNRDTWGCDDIATGLRICLSTGTSPFPEPIQDAVCGPQVPGTIQPAESSPRDWEKLNPCVLNACCNVWGQCGISADFCTRSNADTGSPGTTLPDTNGCISNCGTDITNNMDKPDQFRRIAYFDAFNTQRECLNMDISEINVNEYTHVHFAFAEITSDFIVNVDKVWDQFNGLQEMRGVERILSLGGWSFSTDQTTINTFRTGVQPANYKQFADNVARFIDSTGLDGVDFDWEYPGAQDLPPADDPNSGIYYLEFLKEVRQRLPADKTVSIAAPASFWYLKNFPIKEIADVVDYIVYMTYDLHGQWDYNNKWVDPDCPSGDCLRHHTNDTEVHDALAMITKAGVLARKVVVGMPLYGRSFKMTTPLCSKPFCQYTGPESGAAPGRCTKTPGYISNAEIFEIIATNPNVIQYYDSGDVLVYNDTEWVSWLNPVSYEYHQIYYGILGFGGTSDWAIDLNKTFPIPAEDQPDDYEPPFDPDHYSKCDAVFENIEDLKNQQNSVPSYCMNTYLVNAIASMWDSAMDKFNRLVDDGYDEKFDTYQKYTKALVPTQINTFMGSGRADEFFDCTNDGHITCCRSCSVACWPCSTHADCKDGFAQTKTTCPSGFSSLKAGLDNRFPNTTYALRNGDGFYAAIDQAYGVQKEWITFGDTLVVISNGCQYSNDAIECEKQYGYWYWNYPQAGEVTITNPKDLVTQGKDKAQDLVHQLRLMRFIADLDPFLQMSDLVDAASLPAFSVISAVEAMEKVAKAGDEIEEDQRKESILAFISVIFFIIPFVGEAIGSAGLIGVRVALELIGVVGDIALSLPDVIEDPKSGLPGFFASLISAGHSAAGWTKAAGIKRGISGDTIAKLGLIKDKLDILSAARVKSCRL